MKEQEALAGTRKYLRQYLRPDLLIIDDMGIKKLPSQSGEYLFEVIMRRHENRATIMTSSAMSSTFYCRWAGPFCRLTPFGFAWAPRITEARILSTSCAATITLPQ
jgi:hypothetical protein